MREKDAGTKSRGMLICFIVIKKIGNSTISGHSPEERSENLVPPVTFAISHNNGIF